MQKKIYSLMYVCVLDNLNSIGQNGSQATTRVLRGCLDNADLENADLEKKKRLTKGLKFITLASKSCFCVCAMSVFYRSLFARSAFSRSAFSRLGFRKLENADLANKDL